MHDAWNNAILHANSKFSGAKISGTELSSFCSCRSHLLAWGDQQASVRGWGRKRSSGSMGGPPQPLLLDQTEARPEGPKNVFETSLSSSLIWKSGDRFLFPSTTPAPEKQLRTREVSIKISPNFELHALIWVIWCETEQRVSMPRLKLPGSWFSSLELVYFPTLLLPGKKILQQLFFQVPRLSLEWLLRCRNTMLTKKMLFAKMKHPYQQNLGSISPN